MSGSALARRYALEARWQSASARHYALEALAARSEVGDERLVDALPGRTSARRIHYNPAFRGRTL